MLNDSINRFLGILCYPFVSLDYIFDDAIDDFFKNKKMQQEMTPRIRKSCLKYIRNYFTIYSYDEVYLYLDKCYLYHPDAFNSAYECYYSIFKNLSKSLISQRNGKLVFKYWENEDDEKVLGGFAGNNKVYLLHSLNRHIPMDIIAIVYMLENSLDRVTDLNNFFGHIVVSDLQLDNVLDKGVAENHLHGGVARSFLSLWEELMGVFSKNKTDEFKRLELSNVLGYDEDKLRFYILLSAYIRGSLAFSVSESLNDDKVETDIMNWAETIECEEMYGFMTGKWNEFMTSTSIESSKDNIIFSIFDQDDSLKTSGENLFLFNVIKYIKAHEEKGIDLPNMKKMLMTYLRVKNFIFNLFVQKSTVVGLDYFQKEHYRKNSLMNSITKNRWEKAMREQFENTNLRKIEFRLSPHEKESVLKNQFIDFLKSYKKVLEEDYCEYKDGKYYAYKRFPRVGLVYHLLKSEDKTCPEKCLIDGVVDHGKMNYGDQKRRYELQVENLKKLRGIDCEVSKYIVGLDAASLENSTPIWVFSSPYEIARDSMNEPLNIRNNPLDFFQSLGFTFHAGEDFRHLLSGLRRIDEVVVHLKFHAGDRIGHGTALGMSPEDWKRNNQTIIIPRIEALENYLWAYNILSQNYGNFNTTTLAYLEKQIYKLSKDIYVTTQGLTTSLLVDGYLELFKQNHHDSCSEKNRASFCETITDPEIMNWNVEKLIAARHCKYYLLKMNEPIHFEVSDREVEMIRELQKILKQKISREGIIIEINPSSNTAIGDLDTVGENHIYSINSFKYDATNVMVCINSDDPTVFNTNVSNELAYIYYGLVDRNVSKEDALNWIEKLRDNGMNASFIRRKDTDQQILDNLERLIGVL